jgi:hypothetical protein
MRSRDEGLSQARRLRVILGHRRRIGSPFMGGRVTPRFRTRSPRQRQTVGLCQNQTIDRSRRPSRHHKLKESPVRLASGGP